MASFGGGEGEEGLFSVDIKRRAIREQCGGNIDAGQRKLPWRMAPLIVSPAIAVGQMGHDFHNEQVGTIHHMPGTAIAECADQFLKHVNVKLHSPLGGNGGVGEQTGQGGHFVGQVARPHHDVGPEQFAVMRDQLIGEIASRGLRIFYLGGRAPLGFRVEST